MVEVKVLTLTRKIAEQLKVVDVRDESIHEFLQTYRPDISGPNANVLGTIDTRVLSFGQGYYVLVQTDSELVMVRGIPYSWSENLPRIVLT